MPILHLPRTASPQEVTAALRADGCCIVDDLAAPGVMDRIDEEMSPFVDLTPQGRDNFIGRLTRRTGSMVARSPAARELVMNPLVLGTTALVLEKSATFQLHLTQVISVFPGETPQPLHRDEIGWDYPWPIDYDPMCNTIWAMTEFTKDNGATRVVPGSHLVPGKQAFEEAEEERAVMSRGSAFFYTGKVYHGSGANRSDAVRQGINLTYSVGWVKQEENQFLTTPLEVARTLDDDLLRLLGYQLGGLAMGYVRDFEDPMVVIHEDMPKEQYDGMAQRKKVLGRTTEEIAAFYDSIGRAETPLLTEEPA